MPACLAEIVPPRLDLLRVAVRRDGDPTAGRGHPHGDDDNAALIARKRGGAFECAFGWFRPVVADDDLHPKARACRAFLHMPRVPLQLGERVLDEYRGSIAGGHILTLAHGTWTAMDSRPHLLAGGRRSPRPDGPRMHPRLHVTRRGSRHADRMEITR